MGFTRILRDYDCSFAEYAAGRRVVRPRHTNLVPASTPAVKKLPVVTPVKSKPKKIVTVEDEGVPKLVRFDEKELKKIEHDSVSSKRKRVESKEIFSEGGVKINKRPPQEHASECQDCNIEKFGVPIICDTCIRAEKPKSSDKKDEKKEKKGKEKNSREKFRKSNKKEKEKEKEKKSFWDNAEPWTSGLEDKAGSNTGWNNDAAATRWDNNANNTWGADLYGANWSGNDNSNNANNWDSNGNNNNNSWDNNQNNENGWGEDGNLIGHNAPAWNNTNFGGDNNGSAAWNNNQPGQHQGQSQTGNNGWTGGSQNQNQNQNQNNGWEGEQNQIQQNGWNGSNGGKWNDNQNGINWGNNTDNQIDDQHGGISSNNNQNTNQNGDKTWSSNKKSAPWMNGQNWVPTKSLFPRSEAGDDERCTKIHDFECSCDKQQDASSKTSKKGIWIFVHDDEEEPTKAQKDDQGSKTCHSHHQSPSNTKLHCHQKPVTTHYHGYSWVPDTPSLPCNQAHDCPQTPNVPQASKPESHHWIPDTHFPPTPRPPQPSSPDLSMASYWDACTEAHHHNPLGQVKLRAACHGPPPAHKSSTDISMSRYWKHDDPSIISQSPKQCTGFHHSTLASPYLNQDHGHRRGHSEVVTRVDIRTSPPTRGANAHFDQTSRYLTVYHDD